MLLTRYAPLRRSPSMYCYIMLPLDLHVLSLPLAFILSQDQTLHCIFFISLSLSWPVLTKLIFYYNLYLFHSYNAINELFFVTVVSQTGCKYRHFFLLSKFFSQKNAKFFIFLSLSPFGQPVQTTPNPHFSHWFTAIYPIFYTTDEIFIYLQKFFSNKHNNI